jgi:hypothetical protein
VGGRWEEEDEKEVRCGACVEEGESKWEEEEGNKK